MIQALAIFIGCWVTFLSGLLAGYTMGKNRRQCGRRNDDEWDGWGGETWRDSFRGQDGGRD